MKKAAFILFFVGLAGCTSSSLFIDGEHRDFRTLTPPSDSELIYQVFMIGDAGAPDLENDPLLSLFSSFVEDASENSAAVFLGDNIYNNGLPDSTDPNRAFYEARINAQIESVRNFKGRVVFIPGNHDWDDGGPDGWEAIQRQEEYVEKALGRGNTFRPDNGFPGPDEIKLMDKDDHPALKDDIRLVVLDTQWWLHQHEKAYGDNGDFEVSDASDVINELQDIVRKRKGDYLIVAGHHPFVSNDNHGGHFPAKTHFLPPVFGSLYVMYRKVFGYRQDVAHHDYAQMVDAMEEVLTQKEEIIYISGHAHTLQYHRKEHGKRQTTHYIVSGAGSRTDYVAKGRGAEFAYGEKGFTILKFYTDGSVWLEARAPSETDKKGTLLYRTKVMTPTDGEFPKEEMVEDIDYTDSTAVVAPNPSYDRGGFLYQSVMGHNRRDMWTIESEYPVFDVTEVEGGLEVVRLGGKGQSNTLHLEAKDGRKFVLRSVDKQAGKVWDDALKQSVALEVAQDQFSMLNPFAPLIVAKLALPLGVNYLEPKYYVVPNDPLLGEYGDLMAGKLALFEQKPSGDMRDVSSVGNPEDVISHMDMMREIDGDIDHRVDAELFARSRLFDLLIGDWDRHYDQWRWAAVEPEDEKGKIYQPIPRDRDVAFMVLNGIGPTIAKLGPFFQYQNFGPKYRSLKGLSYNSLGLTRRFTSKLTREDWLQIAREMQTTLTDEVIEEAVRAYPVEAYPKYGQPTAEVLKIRRDKLVEITNQYVDLLNKVVTITASHKREKFYINILSKDTLEIRVIKLSGKGVQKEEYYHRIFTADETKEVRLFGFGDDDEFEISGTSKSDIQVRIIGGAGNDVLTDMDAGTKRNLKVYDTNGGLEASEIKNADYHFSDDPAINHYYYDTDYRWNSAVVGFFFAYNDDDGIFIGGGPRFTKYTFRKNPAQTHFVRGNVAAQTGAGNFIYSGNWYQFAGDWDASLDARALLPKNYSYYFGLGNETSLEEWYSANYYRAQLQQYSVKANTHITLQDYLTFDVGTGLLYTDVNDVFGDNILTNPQNGVNPNVFDSQLYSNLEMGLSLNDLDNASNPHYGAAFAVRSNANFGLNEVSKNHLYLKSETKLFYSSQTKRQLTLAGRVGGEHLIGNFPFYLANSIGGRNAIRGYNGRRFSGRSSFFTNAEVRAELFSFYRYLLGGKVGVLTFFDNGRVWADDEISSKWHQGYGGGIWFNIFDQFLISSTLGFSEEDTSFEIKAGFFF